MAGMAAQGRWRRRNSPHWSDVTAWPWGERGTGVRPPFEGSAVLFRGCGTPAVRVWVAQCQGTDTGLDAQCHTVAGMASSGVLAEQRRDMTPGKCSDIPSCHGETNSIEIKLAQM
jgi:hypothetical protein